MMWRMYKKQNHHSDKIKTNITYTVAYLCRCYFCCLLKSVLLLEIQLSGLNPPYVCAWISNAINHSKFLCSMIWGKSMWLLCFGVDHHCWNKYSADIIRVILVAYHLFKIICCYTYFVSLLSWTFNTHCFIFFDYCYL